MSVLRVVTDSFGKVTDVVEEPGCGCGCILAALFGIIAIPIAVLAIVSRVAETLFGHLSWPSIEIWTVPVAGTAVPEGLTSASDVSTTSNGDIPWIDFAPLGLALVLATTVLIGYFAITRRRR